MKIVLIVVVTLAMFTAAIPASGQTDTTGADSGAQNVEITQTGDIPPEFFEGGSLFVPCSQPIFFCRKRIDPVNGGHTVTLSKEDGMLIDGIVYERNVKIERTLQNYLRYPELRAKIENGFFHYVVSEGGLIGWESVLRGESREETKKAMMDFWAQYSDSLEVIPSDDDFTLRYRDHEVFTSLPKLPKGWTPEDVMNYTRPDFFHRILVPMATEMVQYLKDGNLVFCCKGVDCTISAEDAHSVLEEIKTIKDHAEIDGYLGGEAVYKGYPLLGGKYRLDPITVGDLIKNQ